MPNSTANSTYIYIRLENDIIDMVNIYQRTTRTTRNRAVTELLLHGLGYTPAEISAIIDPDPDPRDQRRPAQHLKDDVFSGIILEARSAGCWRHGSVAAAVS
jgi:hypothetical protein